MFKRLICFICILAMALSLMGCQSGKKEKKEEEAVAIADSLTLLNTVWDSYEENEKFAAGGGDFTTEESMSMDGPAKFGLSDAGLLDSMLGLPESELANVNDAASLMHMMNGNTFTCGAFRVNDGVDLSKLAKTYKDHIMQREWMCGFPDKVLVITLDNYLLAAFGETDIMNTFKEKVLASYPTAKVEYEDAIE